MDKRTLVFAVIVLATFFGLNAFFNYQRNEKNREILRQQEARKEREGTALQAEIKKKTVPLESLPIVSIFSDETQSSRLAQGFKINEGVMTLAWQSDLPETVYVDQNALRLITQDSVIEGPVIYASEKFETLDTASLPEIGQYDIQLLTFPESGFPNVYYAEYSDGNLIIPQGSLSDNAIALLKSNSKWLPFGFYERRGGLFIQIQNLPLLSGMIKSPEPVKKELRKTEQKYFVLENDYQQLVFTNVGGALAEINLPFQTESSESVVKEIGFDREITKDYPSNAHFPLHSYYIPDSSEEQPSGHLGGYYPLLRRGTENKKSIAISPQFYGLNVVSDYPEMAELVYDIKEFTKNKIVFEAVQPHRKITKTYTLADKDSGAPYIFDLTIQVEGDPRGLWLSSGIPEVEIMSNSSSPQIQYRMTRKGKSEVEKLDLPKAKEVVSVSSVHPDWIVNSNGYLGIIMDSLNETETGFRAVAIPGGKVPTRLSVIDPKYQPYPATKYPGYQLMLPLASKGGTMHFRIYAGPFDESVLKAVDKIYSDPKTGYNPDYRACWTFYGWFSFISEPFSKFLFMVMKFFYSITHSWGFSIILLTIFLRLLLYPLNAWSIKSMRRMQKLSPQIQAIQQKYKKEPKKSQMEIMALYREKKVNPFTGCVPILIQIPFLIAMFDLLKSSFQLRGAVFIPGWIDNLTAPDVLFQWSTPIFFIGNQFHLLPFLLGGVMFIQQRLSSTAPKDPNKMTDQQRQQRAMGMIMTVVFTVMFYHFPSGLNLYWLSSMLLGILQQWVTNRYLDKHKEKDIEVLPQKSTKAHTKKIR